MSGGPFYKESTIVLDEDGGIALRLGSPFRLAVTVITMFGKMRFRLKKRDFDDERAVARFAHEVTKKWRLSA